MEMRGIRVHRWGFLQSEAVDVRTTGSGGGGLFPFAAGWLAEITKLALFERAVLKLQSDLRWPAGFGFDHAVHHADDAGDFVDHDFAKITVAGGRSFGFAHRQTLRETLARSKPE